MLINYKRNTEPKTIMLLDDVDAIKDKYNLIDKLRKSNARLSELNERLSKLTEELEKEKLYNERLLTKRYDIYKQETVEELKDKSGGKLPSKKQQIEIYFSEGKGHEEIKLLTGAKIDYIYKVVSEYRKRKGIKKEKLKISEKEEEILATCGLCKTVKQVASSTGVSVQYVYRVLKKYDISFKSMK